MAKDEVELGGEDAGDDYEVVPVGPIRKLERRIDEIEEQSKTGGSRADDELIRDVLDIMKSNQKIVNDMTESTHELKNSVEDLTHKMDSVIDNMNSFMDLLNEASETDLEGEVINDVHARIADAVGSEMQEVAADIKDSNRQVVENLTELNKSIKRSYTSQHKDETLSGSGGVVSTDGNNNSRRRNSGGPDLNISRGQDENSGREGGNQRRNQNSGNQGMNQGSGNQGMNQRQDSGNQRSQRQREGQGRQNDRSGRSGSERMEKLRKRFNNVEDEE